MDSVTLPASRTWGEYSQTWTEDIGGWTQLANVHDAVLKLLDYPMTEAEAEAEAGKMPRAPTEAEASAAVPNLWTIDRLAATRLL